MIPKKIHYVWVGGNPKPKDIQKCMRTWKKYLPDYEIVEWNESNFDINSHPFVKAAYKAKKWAFVSDYIRAYVLYKEGGIYLDTDNCVLRNLDKLLDNKAFVGFENTNYPFTACFGAEPKHKFTKAILDYYDNLDFSFDKNDQMKNVNTKTVSDILIKDFGCKLGDIEQDLKSGLKVYNSNILCNPSKYSYVIHIFTGTWMEGKKNLKKKIIKHLKININSPFRAWLYSLIVGRKL